MTAARLVIGVDPGGTVGIATLTYGDGVLLRNEVLQCSPGLLLPILELLTTTNLACLLAVERFVVGPRAARSSTPAAGRVTRGLISDILREYKACASAVVLKERAAAVVKPWATDTRLAAAGLLDPTKGMPHARDAVRHALYAAVHDSGIPDPLSRKGQ